MAIVFVSRGASRLTLWDCWWPAGTGARVFASAKSARQVPAARGSRTRVLRSETRRRRRSRAVRQPMGKLDPAAAFARIWGWFDHGELRFLARVAEPLRVCRHCALD